MPKTNDMFKEIVQRPHAPSRQDQAGSQAVYQVNCPFCGVIVQVVSPRPGIAPRSVQAYASGSSLFWGHSCPNEVRVGCTNPDCGKAIFVCWSFA